MRLIPVLGLVALLLGAAAPALAQPATPPAATPIADGDDFAGLVDIGDDRRLWLECRGQGSPTVVLDSGYGNNAQIWDAIALPPDSGQTAVLPGVAAFTRVCAYDRPGTVLDAGHRSRSDPAPMPRTAADAVADLHALLSTAGVPGPYVLVGHSLGGVIGRLYAAAYPDEVAGLVLVDSAHEEQNTRLEAALGAEAWAAFSSLQQQTPPGLEDYSEREQIDLDASFAQLRTAAEQPLPPLPLIVLSHGRPYQASDLSPELQSELPPDFPWSELERSWQEMQTELAGLAPGARHVMATESGHYIQLSQPDLVIDAIRQVVDAVGDPKSWSLPAASPGAATPTA